MNTSRFIINNLKILKLVNIFNSNILFSNFKNNILYLEPGRLQMLEYRLG